MSTQGQSRRSFIIESVSGLGGVWVMANYPAILAAAEHVNGSPESAIAETFAFFTPEQAVEVEAVAAQIIPTDETPGAREARVISFIDRVLVTFDRDRQPDYEQGLGDLRSATRNQFPGSDRFSDLTFDQQMGVLKDIEDIPFFNLVRTHTITGFFAHPIHGGNYGKVGWQLLGYDDSLQHEPPFGYYDARPHIRP